MAVFSRQLIGMKCDYSIAYYYSRVIKLNKLQSDKKVFFSRWTILIDDMYTQTYTKIAQCLARSGRSRKGYTFITLTDPDCNMTISHAL